MLKRRSRRPEPRRWPSPSLVLAGAALFVVLGGSAVAATSLIKAGDIAPGAVTSKAIRDGGVGPNDLSASAQTLLAGGPGAKGETGANGSPGSSGVNGANGPVGASGVNGANGANGPAGASGANGANGPAGASGTDGTSGANGANGPAGANGAEGAKGANGTDGTNGANGANGPNGANGANGVDGTNGIDGTDGEDGAAGSDGADGTITPLSAKQGLTALPTGVAATTVVALPVPPGSYVVLAKTQLSHTGAGDSVECLLKSGAATLDQSAMKTLPALASVPASMQAVTTTVTAPTVLSVQCSVAVANGAANFSSLIAIPTA